jgi:hypothetical protein
LIWLLLFRIGWFFGLFLVVVVVVEERLNSSLTIQPLAFWG